MSWTADTPIDELLLALDASSRPLYLALSGGLDSVFLFHRLIQLKVDFQAIHINHQLQPQSIQWQQFCEELCRASSVNCISLKVDVDRLQASLEQAARLARQQAFKQVMTEPSVLLTAHHLDDQIETFFLRLLRGASLNGLQSMHVTGQLGEHQLVKPLLSIKRQYIQQQSAWMTWIEDPTNQQDDFDRNFLRNQVLPLLAQRWPEYQTSIARSIQAITQAYQLESQQYNAYLQCNAQDAQLDLSYLGDLSLSQLVYYWTRLHLKIIVPRTVINAVAKLNQARQWQSAYVNCQLGHFVYRPPNICFIRQDALLIKPHFRLQKIRFQFNQKMPVIGLRADIPIEQLVISSRPANQKIKVVGRNKRRDLKRLLQELALTTEQKQVIPYVFWREQLVCIGAHFIVEEFACLQNEAGIEIICSNQD